MKRISANGFTIVETLVVLAVSGVLFASTAVMVSGQQTKARFKSSMTDIVSQIELLINETATGSYPSSGNFTCASLPGDVINLTGANTEQGQNNDCVFMGRAMIFGLDGSDYEKYVVHTLSATRTQAGAPRITMRGVEALYKNPALDWSETRRLEYGTQIQSVRDGGGTLLSGFAIVTDPSQATPFEGVIKSGATTMQVVGIPGPTVSTVKNGAENIKARFSLPGSPPASVIKLCFKGGMNQSGLVTIGGNMNASVNLTIYNNSSTCA